MTFKRITIGDRHLLEDKLLQSHFSVSDYNFTHFYLWGDAYRLEYQCLDEALLIQGVDLLTGVPFVYMPIGTDRPKAILDQWMSQEGREFSELLIRGVTSEMLRESDFATADWLSFQPERDESEYLYQLERIAGLQGRDLRRKREMCQSFENRYRYRFIPYETNYLKPLMLLFDQWQSENGGRSNPLLAAEYEGTLRLLEHYDLLSCQGFIVVIDDIIAGFILADFLTMDTLVVHIEKGSRDFKGIYDILKRDLARHFLHQYAYINLEEDMGIAGLRKAKKLYRPDQLLQKGSLRIGMCHYDREGERTDETSVENAPE